MLEDVEKVAKEVLTRKEAAGKVTESSGEKRSSQLALGKRYHSATAVTPPFGFFFNQPPRNVA